MVENNPYLEFDAVASQLLEECAAAAPQLPSMVEEAKVAKEEALQILAAATESSESDEEKAIFKSPGRQLMDISDKIVDLNTRIGKLVSDSVDCTQAFREWHRKQPNLLRDLHSNSRLSASEQQALAEFTVALVAGPSTWTFFGAMPTLPLIDAVSDYRDAGLRFLQRRPGKRYDFRAAMGTILDAGADAIVDAATFNFGSTLLRASMAALTPPVERDIENMQAATTQLSRVFQLRRTLSTLNSRIDVISGVVAASEDAVESSISEIESSGALITKIYQQRGGGLN